MEFFYSALFLSTLFILLTLMITKLKRHRKDGIKEAPGPWALPILGNLHRVVRQKPPHQSLRDLSAVYGPVMRLKLGEHHTVIISSAEAAKEVMMTHDIVFATRPISQSAEAIFYGSQDVVFSGYGDFWRQMRRLCVVELLSAKRVRSFRAVREEEVSHLIRLIAASSGKVVNISSKMAETSNNIIARAAIGGRCEDQKLFLSALADAVELFSGFTIMDLFPSMPLLGYITGFQQKLRNCQKNLDLMAEKIIHDHKEKMANHSSSNEKILMEEDFIDGLLRIQQEDSLQFRLTNNNIKALVNDMLMAGSETTSTTLEWAMSELVFNQTIMKKAQMEAKEVLNEINKQEKLVDEELISGRLPYLQLVLKETLRMHPPAPLLLPRENQKSCEVLGYLIPLKTTVIINMWAIGRDKTYWHDPLVFRPERFQDSLIDFKGAFFEYAPFGSGRRICPGIQFALASLEIILAHLLYYFEWGFVGEKIDMREASGLTTRRKIPLCLVPTLRFPILS